MERQAFIAGDGPAAAQHFHAAAVSANGYRYYTYSQSALLETILMLRELNVSIAEIAVFLRVRSAASLETLLADKGAELDETISHLKAVRAVV